MATAAETITVELLARTEQFDRKIRASADGINRSRRTIEDGATRQERTLRRSTEDQAEAVRKLEGQVRSSSDAIGSQFRTLAATLAAAFSVQQIAEYADAYTRFTNQLKVAGFEGEALGAVQEKLFGISQKYGQELETIGVLFGRTSQGAKELGATQAELIEFTTGVAAALKVQGSSAADSRGALLQLTQALGGEIVRAEEFNSINEGARPILQAVANGIDKYAGSVARLRKDVIEGKVSSEEFFRAFLSGSAALQAQADKTTLTIGNSFTVLNNALGKYIGEADQSLSATEQISAAIISLSENIDVVAKAVAVLSVLLLGRFAAGLVSAAGSTGLATVALAQFQARAAGTITTTAALAVTARAAGTSLLAAFGGPVGLAVSALAGGVLYLATTTETAAQATERLTSAADDAEAKARTYEERLRKAGVAVTLIGDAADVASGQVNNLADQMQLAGEQALALFKQLNGLELIRIGNRLKAIDQERGLLQGPTVSASNPIASLAFNRARELIAPDAARTAQREKDVQIAALARERAGLLGQLEGIRIANERGIDLSDEGTGNRTGGGTAAKPTKPKTPKAPKAPSGPTAAEIEERFASDLARLRAEQLQAEAALATNVDERADLFQELLNLERAERVKQIQNDKDFTQAQKDAQIAELDRLFGSRTQTTDADGNVTVARGRDRGLLEQQLDRDVKRQQLAQAQELLSLEADALEAQASITFALDDRFALENRVLEIQQEIERQLLEQAIANGEIAEADKARALLAQQQTAQREDQALSQQSPFEQFRQDLTTDSLNLNDALENIGVDALKTINDELTDAIVNFNSFGDVGRAALKSITTQLVQLALQQILLKTIGASVGSAAVAATSAQAAATGAAWAPAAAAASLATLGANAGPAAVALASTTALAQALAATGGLKDGGPVSGPGGPRDDKILKRLSAGEYVINARASSGLGRRVLDFINATGQLPDVRALGGSVGPRLSIPNGMATPAGGGGGMAGIDQRSIDRLAAIVGEASRAMPPVQLFPTLDPAGALSAGLNSPGGQRVFFDFVSQNSGKFNGALAR